MTRRTALAGTLLTLAGAAGLALLPPVRAGLATVAALLAAGDLAGVRDYLRGFGVWAPVVSILLVQLQAVIAPLPSFPLMYANGLLFGTWWGGLLSWASILLSAVLCFGLARRFGRPVVERLVSPAALARADRHLARYGPLAVLVGRLVPLTAFDLLSYAAGLTRMRLLPFALATAVGMAPAVFLTAAAADLGWHAGWRGGPRAGWHPAWAWALALGGLAGLAALGFGARRWAARRLAGAADPVAPPGQADRSKYSASR